MEIADRDSTQIVVVASETTPRQAKDIEVVAHEYASDTRLVSFPEQKWHYGSDFGFAFTGLDISDSVQAALDRVQKEHELKRREQSEVYSKLGVHPIVEPFSWILVIVGAVAGRALGHAVGEGFGKKIGEDLWHLVKHIFGSVPRLLTGGRRRKNAAPDNDVAALFDRLLKANRSGPAGDAVLFLQFQYSR